MIKDLKKQARSILSNNYKDFLFPTLLNICSNFAVAILFPIIFNGDNLVHNNLLFRVALLFLYLVVQFVVFPISDFILFKTSLQLVNKDIKKKDNISSRSTLKDFLIIISVWLAPRLINDASKILNQVTKYPNLPESSAFLIMTILLFLMIVSIYLEYKFFACNYCYALKKGTAKDTLKSSFKIMNGQFSKYLLVILSFLPLYLLSTIISLFFANILDANTISRKALQSIGCGVNFYILPYQFITFTLFIKNISKTRSN